MDRPQLLKLMRYDYMTHDIASLKRRLALGKYILTDEDKTKIEAAIAHLDGSKMNPLVLEALKILGGRIVPND